MRWIVPLVIGLAWVPPLLANEVGDCQDGSTCHVTADAYSGPVKLFCVDAPAITDPIGRQATEALRAEIRGTIRLLMDSQDRGVPIAEFIRDDDGRNLGLELIRSGLARVNAQYCDEIPYLLAENEARLAKVGLWATPDAFKCRGPRYCIDVKSCDEALFYLRECGRTDFDRDHDGIPCEGLCPTIK